MLSLPFTSEEQFVPLTADRLLLQITHLPGIWYILLPKNPKAALREGM